MVIYTSPIAGTSENCEGRIIVDESDYRLVDEKLPFETKDVVRIRAKEKFSKLYECFDVIGEGKFGKVYRCREKESGLELAAKRIKIKRDADRQQVEKEVAIMTQMRHPRIAQIYDAFSTPENDIVLVMEVVPGGELFDRVVQENYILTELAVVMIICQLCEAVDYIHSKHIVHLDIKPENIMCVSQTSNRIKLIDFGLAQYYDGTSNLLFMAGTPEFVAPEVIKFEPLDFHTDMWSIGVITYILLSGISPFLGETLGETYCAVEKGDWEFDEECFEGISEEAKDFISKLLVYDQKERMLPAECLQHAWIVQARARTACQSPVCEANEGKPISKEILRSYIKNQRFRRATWAVLFLMRFKKFGHITWPTASSVLDAANDKTVARLKDFPQNVIALDPKHLGQLPCVIIESNVNVTRTVDDDHNDRRQVNVEVHETVARPINLLENQIQAISLRDPICSSGLGEPAAISKKPAKIQEYKTVEQLSDFLKLSTELTVPLQQLNKTSFQCSDRQIQVKLCKKSRTLRAQKLFAPKLRTTVQQTVRLKKPIRKEFCFKAKTVNKCADIIIAKAPRECIFSCVREKRIQKRAAKCRSLIIPSKLIPRSAELRDLNNNRDDSAPKLEAKKFQKPSKSISKSDDGKNLANEARPYASQCLNNKKPEETVCGQEILTNTHRLDSFATSVNMPTTVKVSKRVFLTKKLNRTSKTVESTKALKPNNVDDVNADEKLPVRMRPKSVVLSNEQSEQPKDFNRRKTIDSEKCLRSLRTTESDSLPKKPVKTKKPLTKKLDNTPVVPLQPKISGIEAVKGLNASESGELDKSEKSSFAGLNDSTKGTSTEKSTNESSVVGEKTVTTTALSKFDSIINGLKSTTDSDTNKIVRPKEQRKYGCQQESENAKTVESCQKTFKITSNRQNQTDLCCYNFYKSDGKPLKYSEAIKLSVRQPQTTKMTASQKKSSKSTKTSLPIRSNSETLKGEPTADETPVIFRRTTTTGKAKGEREDIAKFRLSDAKCSVPVIVSDQVPRRPLSEEVSELSQPKTTTVPKTKTGNNLEWLKSRLEQNFKLNNSVNMNRKPIDMSKKITSNTQQTLKMWKLSEKSDGSATTAPFNPLKVL